MYFNHKHGCSKCTIVGRYDHVDRRTCFAQFNLPSRTDIGFRQRHDHLHHKEKTPLEDIESPSGKPFLDMVRDIPVSDDLHLLHQGVTKKCLNIWINGSSTYKKKWSASDKNDIDESIRHCNKRLASDINRQVRSLRFLKYYKATEYRTIAL